MIDLALFVDHFFNFFDSPLGVLSFIALYALWVTILLPGLWLSMFAGVLYGSLFGSIFVFMGAFLGAELTFFLGRKFLRNWIKKRISSFKKYNAIQNAVANEGLSLIFLTRLSPAFPFSLLNLAYGLSEVSLRDYTIGLIGILPGTILYCGLGSLAGDIAKFNLVLSDRKDISSVLFSSLGLCATLAVVYLLTRAIRNALQGFDSST